MFCVHWASYFYVEGSFNDVRIAFDDFPLTSSHDSGIMLCNKMVSAVYEEMEFYYTLIQKLDVLDVLRDDSE